MPIKEDTLQGGSAGRKHPVPQNVMDVEFKVVGDLTVRQLMYLFTGISFAYIFHKSGLPGFWRWLFMLSTGGLSVAVAFIPIQERSLDKWLISFIKAMVSPGQRVWRKAYSTPAYFLADYAQIIRNEIITLTPAKSRSKLDEYLGQLPESKDLLDEYEDNKLQNIGIAFSKSSFRIANDDTAKTPSLTETETTVITDEPLTGTLVEKETSFIPTEREKKKTEAPRDQIPNADILKQERLKPSSALRKEIEKDEIKSKVELVKAVKQPPKKPKKIKIDLKSTSRGVDRALVNLPSELKGEIEINLKTKIPRTIVEESIAELQRKENELTKNIKELLEVTQKAKIQLKYASGDQSHNIGRIDFFKSKYDKLQEERETISEKLKASSTPTERFEKRIPKEVEIKLKTLSEKNRQLKDQLTKINSELQFLRDKTEQVDLEGPQSMDSIQTKPLEHQTKQPSAKTSQGDYMEPNVISGIVKDKNGNLIEGAVIIIKDVDGDVVRALKTNKLGHFKTQTAVPSGKYTIEAIRGGEKFDIIAVEATGEALDPIYLVSTAT